MPFLDPNPDLQRLPEGVTPPTPPSPTLEQTFGAAFRQDSPIVNLYRRRQEEIFPPEPDHNPLDVIRGTDYEARHLDNFVASRSTAETNSIMRRIDEEEADRKTLDASGVAGFVAQIAAGTIDPTLALPGGVAVRSIRGGYSVGRSALSVGIAAAGQTAAQEAVLQATQETRTAGESVAAVASSAILGGILGAGAAGLLSRAERTALEKSLDADRAAIDAHATGMPAPAGAAATDTRQLELFKTPLDKLGMQKLSVTRRTMQAELVDVRRTMADIAETPYRFKENEAGVAATQGPAVDRLARMQVNGARVTVADELDRQFADYRFGQADKFAPRLRARIDDFTGSGEGKMTFTDFKKEVSLAAMGDGTHAIPQVAAAADFVRKNHFEPWAARAEKSIEGFERTTPVEGESYFPHVWNKEKIKAQRPEFTNRLTDLFVTDQANKRGIQQRLQKLSDDLEAARNDLGKAKDPDVIAAAQKRHDDIRVKIEEQIGSWEGRSASEAKSAIKAREKYGQARAEAKIGAGPVARLTSADDAIDRVVAKILKSNRELGVEDLRARASQTVDRIISSPDGRLPYDMHMGGPRIGFHDGPPQRGSLAERKLNVTNAWARDWIENDIEHVVAMHSRTVIPDVLLSERFGDVEMTDAFRRINEGYAQLIDKTKPGPARDKLTKERDAVIRDLAAVRDRVRGVYGWSPDLQNMARIANSAKAINNMTSMGVSAISSLPDLAGTVFRYGLGSSFRDGWAPFFSNLKSSSPEWTKFKTDMRAIGIGVETAINARQHSLDDVFDVYRPQSRVERVLQGASDKFFIANMLAPLTDAEKLIAAHVSVSNVLKAAKATAEGKATKRQIGNLAESGIDPHMAGRIWQQFNDQGGDVVNGVHLPNTAGWKDKAAAEALNGAVARDVDIMVVTPGQEKPLWMSKPVISLIGQFKSFTASATERILVANMQRRDAAALQGLVFSLGLGMLSYKLNSFFGGQKTSDRPQDWVKEGISRAGLLGWFEDANALASKASRGSVDIYRTIGADKPLSRFVSRSAADMLLGPTWGKINELPKITGSIAGVMQGKDSWSAADTTAIRRLVPLQNLFWLRGLLNQAEASTNEHFGVPPKPDQPKH